MCFRTNATSTCTELPANSACPASACRDTNSITCCSACAKVTSEALHRATSPLAVWCSMHHSFMWSRMVSGWWIAISGPCSMVSSSPLVRMQASSMIVSLSTSRPVLRGFGECFVWERRVLWEKYVARNMTRFVTEIIPFPNQATAVVHWVPWSFLSSCWRSPCCCCLSRCQLCDGALREVCGGVLFKQAMSNVKRTLPAVLQAFAAFPGHPRQQICCLMALP